MLINYSNWFASYITGFPQLKGTILDRLAPIFENPQNKENGGCLKLATFLLFLIHQLNIFLPNFGSKSLPLAANGVLVEKNPLFCLILGFWKASILRIFGLPEWSSPQFFYVSYISCPNLGQKSLPLAANKVLVEKINFFLPNFGSGMPHSKKIGVCLKLATFLLFVIYQLFIFLPKFGSKTIAISCQLEFSGRNPLFCLCLGQNRHIFHT